MWTYSVATVYNFYAIVVRNDNRDLSKLAGLLQLTGFTARSLDKSGNNSIMKSWKTIFDNLNKIASMPIGKAYSKARSTPTKLNAKKLQEAKENPRFLKEEPKQELRPIITETGNSVANVFLKVGSPVVF